MENSYIQYDFRDNPSIEIRLNPPWVKIKSRCVNKGLTKAEFRIDMEDHVCKGDIRAAIIIHFVRSFLL